MLAVDDVVNNLLSGPVGELQHLILGIQQLAEQGQLRFALHKNLACAFRPMVAEVLDFVLDYRSTVFGDADVALAITIITQINPLDTLLDIFALRGVLDAELPSINPLPLKQLP